MADIDMIPRSYRERVRVRRTLRAAGAALACVAVLGAGAVGAIRWRVALLAHRADALDAASARAQADQARGAALQEVAMRRLREDAALHALRREGELDALAHGIERSLGEQVWLTEMTLERDAQAASAKDGAAATTTLSIAGAAGQPGWRLASSFQLKGQADDYAAVTAFLGALAREPGLAEVRLLASAADGDGRTIHFEAAGMLVGRSTP